jgi:glutamine amidotransferase-like uncharacterized protein
MDIVVYVDRGVDGGALRQTVKSLQEELDASRYTLKRMDAEAIKTTSWEADTALLIIPGGRDIYYDAALGAEGARKIRQFVVEGGAYLGLCAGAYFASRAIEFEKGGNLEVCATRCLEFYPGLAVGPAYGKNKYSYQDERGVEAALLAWNNEEGVAYYNGGCFFEAPHEHPGVKVLATYAELEGSPAAVVLCEVGKGRAVLSGVHIEYNPKYLSQESRYINRIYPLLTKGEEKRKALFRETLNILLGEKL